MLIDEVTSSGPMPALEMMLRFAGARQRVLANNIANLDTPSYRALDASPVKFQRALREAIDRRRDTNGGATGELNWKDTKEVHVSSSDGTLSLTPRTPGSNILAHDRTNGDLERSMQDLVENVTVFRAASDLFRAHSEMLRQAMSERV